LNRFHVHNCDHCPLLGHDFALNPTRDHGRVPNHHDHGNVPTPRCDHGHVPSPTHGHGLTPNLDDAHVLVRGPNCDPGQDPYYDCGLTSTVGSVQELNCGSVPISDH
ncbi:hypothetical protein CSA_017676, partial [Cucumis sativus]